MTTKTRKLTVISNSATALLYRVIPADLARPIALGAALFAGSVPELAELRRTIDPHFEGGTTQVVEVIDDGQLKNMFIDDLAQVKDLPRNERATRIFRSHFLSEHPGLNPESLPFIAGPAVIFDRKIRS